MELQKEGHVIEYYVRKDGGILIRTIDGKKYTGASGNAVARTMAGAKISEARLKQLKHITAKRTKKRKALPSRIKTEYERVKKIWNKRFKAKEGKPHPAGYFDKSRIQYSLDHYGEAEALRRISEAERYATGYAYSKNVEALARFIESTARIIRSEELNQLAQDILSNSYSIKEEWIQPTYDELYKLNAGVNVLDVINNVRMILKL